MDIQKLEELIEFYKEKYWKEHESIISDTEYDALLEQLREKDPNHRLLKTVEYSNIIIDKIKHPIPLLSLKKVFSYNEIKKWMNKISRSSTEEFYISPKYDGMCAKYYVKENILATRGDGEYGENITNKLQLLKILSNKTLQSNIVGEIVIKHEDFKNCKLIKQDGSNYSNPRNLVSGLMNIKDIQSIINNITLYFIDHEYTRATTSLLNFNEEYWENILVHINKIKDETYPIDGIVIELKDKQYLESLGTTSHHPRGKIAYKFEDIGVESTLKDVIFQMGKRKLTPVGIIDPITLSGSVVKRVSLHNAKTILDNDICIGDKVKIIKSGDIIPYMISSSKGENRKKIKLNSCPYCDSKLQYKEPELYCTNSQCEGNLSKNLYESIKILGIDGVGQKTVNRIMEYLEINDIIDFFYISEEDLLDIPDFGKVSAANFINQFDNIRKSIEDYKVLASLNIRGVGVSLSKKILKHHTLADLQNITQQQLMNIYNIGEIRAYEIINDLNNKSDLIVELIEELNIINTKYVYSNPSKGTICFSGKFPRKKDFYKELAIKANFTVIDNVTKELTYLVTAGPATSKVTKAKSYRIPVIQIEQFLELIN